MVISKLFSLEGKVVAITGAGGLLGQEHALAVARAGGVPLLLEISPRAMEQAHSRLKAERLEHYCILVDLADEKAVIQAARESLNVLGPVWGLVNNVASNPPATETTKGSGRLENFSLSQWERDLELGLTVAFLSSKYFGSQMASSGIGSIVNVASDLAIISPDQRMYAVGHDSSTPPPVKAVTYSVAKSGLLGLTKYLATYWAPMPIRCNALLPGSVAGTQSTDLIRELEARIPLGRLARPDEYSGALVFLLSEASAYMNGANLVMDGGRSTW